MKPKPVCFRPTLLFLLIALTFFVYTPPALPQEIRRAPELSGRTWINASTYKKLTMKALRGKAVIVFFWTLNDTNSLNALSILNIWYERYKPKGLEIIGVCSPEWEFNKSHSELLETVMGLDVKFPVVMDEDSDIRDAYGLLSWPAFFLVDRQGYIRVQYQGNYDNFSYEAMRGMLKQLLEEGNYERKTRRAVAGDKE